MSSGTDDGQHGMDTSVPSIAVAVVAAFVISATWYAVWGRSLARLHPAYSDGPSRPPVLTLGVEVVRNLVIALVVARLLTRMEVSGLSGGLGLGLALWIGFPLVILSGSVFHEHVPAPLAAIHAGDWLLKLLAVCAVLAVWN